MKTFGNLNFGVASIVNAGQRQTVVEPQLIVTSTPGGFRITPPVTKLLGIQHGDYVMFINNIGYIDTAIDNQVDEVVAFCERNGLDINDASARLAIHKEFDEWYIAKGIQICDAKGNPKMTKERLTKDERMNFVNNNFEAMRESVLKSGNEELVASITRDGVTKEEVSTILMKFVEGQTVPSMTGSKCANSSKMAGVGTTLNFTDSAVWTTLKSDLSVEDSKKINRVYNLNLENVEKIGVPNGAMNEDGSQVLVEVNAIPFISENCAPAVDEKPISRSEKKANNIVDSVAEAMEAAE